MRTPRTLSLVLFCLAIAGAVRADDTLESLLARPMSPGNLALLIPYSTTAQAATHWAEALKSPDPHVRATGARLLHVSAAKSTEPLLKEALGTEANAGAGREMALALIRLGDPADDDAILKAASRLKVSDVAMKLARARGPASLSKLPQVMDLTLLEPDAVAIVTALVGHDPGALDQAAAVVLDAKRGFWWTTLLRSAEEDHLTLAPSRVEAGLQSSSSEIRDATWWYLLILASTGRTVPALDRPPRDSVPSDATPETAFAHELTARALKAQPIPQPALEARARNVGLKIPSFADSVLRGTANTLLLQSERDALHYPVPAEGASQSNAPASINSSDFGSIRTASDFPEGYVADVLAQTGCLQPDFSDLGGAIVTFEGNRLSELKWVASSLPQDCAAAARYITAASLSPLWDPAPGKAALILLPMHKAYLQCLASETTPAVDSGLATRQAPIHVGHDIKPPTKIRNVNPVYPPSAIQARVQGIVIIESVISETGCVESAKLLRGVTTELDASAFRAVTGWLFTPTLLNGTPVPVVMTVTVQFTLK